MNNNDPDAAKYLNSPESIVFNKRKNLFALNLAKKTKLGYLILVEGYMDAVALHQYGFDCAVASLGTALTEEQAKLMSNYTDQVVLIYDGDNAGQNATRRAIPMLEKAGLQVKVLRMKDAKDPDEYLKKFGADRFKLLLEDASNRVEYQINAIRSKYDIALDEQRVEFIQECAQLLATLSSSVQREVYGRRVAEAGGISYDAMKLEINKAYKRRISKEKKAQEKTAMEPVRAVQPKSRGIRYDNVRSAVAEEGVISMVLREPALLDLTGSLKPEEFSSPLLGRVFSQMTQRHAEGLAVSFATLEDLSGEEASHLAGILQRESGPVNEQALRDYMATIHAEHQKKQVSSEDDLLKLRNQLKESKGYKA